MAGLIIPWLLWSATATAGIEGALTSFDQFYALSKAEAAEGRPFMCDCVVLSFDAGWNQLYVSDANKAQYLPAQTFHSQLNQGDYVKITAVTGVDGNGSVLSNLDAVVLGKKPLPAARHIGLAQLADTTGQWIQVEAEVRGADTNVGRLELSIHQAGQNCLVYVLGPPSPNVTVAMGARARIRGINTSQVDDGRLRSRMILVPGTNDLFVLNAPGAALEPLPVFSIDYLLHREIGPWTNEIVHINGWITDYHPGQYLTVKDPTGVIEAEVVQILPAELGERADVWGLVTRRREGVRLESAYFRTVNPPTQDGLFVRASASSNVPPAEGLKTITTAAAIRRLTPEEAARGYPVRLRGVLTYADPEWHSAFFQDKTDALYAATEQSGLHSGQVVELTGQTDPGNFAPSVVNATFSILGSTNLPPPRTMNMEDLADGHLDSRWIQVRGVIQHAKVDNNHLRLALTGDKGKFTVIVPSWNDRPIPSQWINSCVSVCGACAADVNLRRQLGGITIFTPDLSQIKTIEAAPSDPFATALIPIASVATFNPGRAGRRVAVSGVVTMLLLGQGFVLQDFSGGIRVRTEQTNEIHVGDRLDAVGFPALGEFSPHLENAIFRHSGSGLLPLPKSVTAEAILRSGACDNTIVELQSLLLQKVVRSLQPKLVLQDGSVIFTATIQDPKQADAAFALAPGSLLRLRGICLIDGSPGSGAETFHLRLSQPGAVELLRAPPSWTAQDALRIAVGLGLAVVAALAWIGLLRRQVRAQTEIIRSNQKQLIDASRQAGMAEVATGVLHNVGNILNSVNVSTSILCQKVRQSKIGNLSKAAAMLREHQGSLADFLTRDPKGSQIPAYLTQLAACLAEEQTLFGDELASLEGNIEHIKIIVAMQQNYAKVAGFLEIVHPVELVEDALRLNSAALLRHHVEIRREFDPHLPTLTIDKHKALQVIVNLIRNAKYACDPPEVTQKRMTLRVTNGAQRVRISVTDTGVGIPAENLTRIFSMGFTTRANGHGFGLHSGALAARELGGALSAQSEGPGKGATFTLELPVSTDPAGRQPLATN
jgi:signal transduction histidine kinase